MGRPSQVVVTLKRNFPCRVLDHITEENEGLSKQGENFEELKKEWAESHPEYEFYEFREEIRYLIPEQVPPLPDIFGNVFVTGYQIGQLEYNKELKYSIQFLADYLNKKGARCNDCLEGEIEHDKIFEERDHQITFAEMVDGEVVEERIEFFLDTSDIDTFLIVCSLTKMSECIE
ncbi:MAG: hypothetical protein ABEJ24_02430, partial [Candidatus Magasanikbacteria bacterium]